MMWISHFSTAGRKVDEYGHPKQEDAYYLSPVTENGLLLLVADGVGGHAHGEFASSLTVEIFKNNWSGLHPLEPDDLPLFLRQQAMNATLSVYKKAEEDPEYTDCATTLTGCLIQGDRMVTVNVGDSRVYRLNRQEELQRLTRDHSPVQQLVDQGRISLEEARLHPLRNQINSAIGMSPAEVRIDTGGPYTLLAGELLLICSDGIHDYLSDEAIREVLIAYREEADLAERLAMAALHTGRSTDNITACIYKHQNEK